MSNLRRRCQIFLFLLQRVYNTRCFLKTQFADPNDNVLTSQNENEEKKKTVKMKMVQLSRPIWRKIVQKEFLLMD